MEISRFAFKAARILLDLEQKDVERFTGIPRQRISSFETGNMNLGKKTFDLLQQFYVQRGIEFLEHDGVRRKPEVEFTVLEGLQGFRAFIDDVYQFASTVGGAISIINGSTEEFIKWLGKDWYARHADRMAAIKDNINFRIITSQQNREIASAFATYKTIPGKQFSPQTIYLYGDNVGFIIFSENEIRIFKSNHKEITETLHYLFDLMWDKTQ